MAYGHAHLLASRCARDGCDRTATVLSDEDGEAVCPVHAMLELNDE